MLSNKYWMPAHRHLFAVIWDDCRRKPCSDEVGGMTLNGVRAPCPLCTACPFRSNETLRGKRIFAGVKVFAQWLTCFQSTQSRSTKASFSRRSSLKPSRSAIEITPSDSGFSSANLKSTGFSARRRARPCGSIFSSSVCSPRGNGFSPGSPSTLPQQTAAFRIIPRFIVHMSPAFRSRHRRPYSKTPLSPTQATSTCPDRTASHKASDLMNHNHRPRLISDMLLL